MTPDPSRWPRWFLDAGDESAIRSAAARALARDGIPQRIMRNGVTESVLGCPHPGIEDALTGSAFHRCGECGLSVTNGTLIL